MSARLSYSLPETPASDKLRSQLRASYGVQESPLKRHTSGWRPFADGTAMDRNSDSLKSTAQGSLPPSRSGVTCSGL